MDASTERLQLSKSGWGRMADKGRMVADEGAPVVDTGEG